MRALHGRPGAAYEQAPRPGPLDGHGTVASERSGSASSSDWRRVLLFGRFGLRCVAGEELGDRLGDLLVARRRTQQRVMNENRCGELHGGIGGIDCFW